MTPAELLELHIAEVITTKQYDVLLLRIRGLSQQQIATGLHITREAVRERERAAWRNITNHRRLNANDQPSAAAS